MWKYHFWEWFKWHPDLDRSLGYWNKCISKLCFKRVSIIIFTLYNRHGDSAQLEQKYTFECIINYRNVKFAKFFPPEILMYHFIVCLIVKFLFYEYPGSKHGKCDEHVSLWNVLKWQEAIMSSNVIFSCTLIGSKFSLKLYCMFDCISCECV